MNDFELIYYRHNLNPENTYIQKNKIGFNELTFVIGGELEYMVNGTPVKLNEKDVVFIKSGSFRERIKAKGPVDYVSINFRTNENLDLPVYIKGGLTREIMMLFAFCDETSKNAYLNSYKILGPINKSVLEILKKNLLIKSENILTVKVKKYIHENLKEHITLSDIASNTFYSAIYLETIFKKDTGKSIIEYLIDERLSVAKKMLSESSIPLTEIAESVGFLDYNYFARTFKKRTGYTPTQYKRQYLNKRKRR